MTDRVDRIGAALFALLAATVAALIFGSVPFSVLDEHLFAYATMSLTMGSIASVGFFFFMERVVVPVADMYYAWRNARAESRCTGECGRQHF